MMRIFSLFLACCALAMSMNTALAQRGSDSGTRQQIFLLQVSAFPQTINLDRESRAKIIVQLSGQAVAKRKIMLQASSGSIVPRNILTDTTGSGEAELRVGPNEIGEIIITASFADQVSSETKIIVTNGAQGPSASSAPPPQLYVEYPELPADGQSATRVMFKIVDWNSVGIANQTVTFSTTAGSIDEQAYTNQNGEAIVYLIAPTSAATAMVTGTAGTVTATAQMQFIAQAQPVPTSVAIKANPESAIADGQTQVTLYAAVYDDQNRMLTDVPVNFVTSAGTINQPSVMTDATGVATVTLIAPIQAGKVTITAVALGLMNTIQIDFTASGAVPTQDTPGIPSTGSPQSALPADTPVENENSYVSLVAPQIRYRQQDETRTIETLTSDGVVQATYTLDESGFTILTPQGLLQGYGTEEGGKARFFC